MVLLLNANLGGWARLARAHRRDGERPPGAYLSSGTFRIFMGYSNVLYIAGTAEGLHLSVIKLFKIGHPNLLVPWDRVEALGPSAIPFGRWVRLRVDGVPVSILEDAWEDAKRHRP